MTPRSILIQILSNQIAGLMKKGICWEITPQLLSVGVAAVLFSPALEILEIDVVCVACPGSPFAERSLWINVSMWLWTFNIKRAPGYEYVSDDSAFIPDVRICSWWCMKPC